MSKEKSVTNEVQAVQIPAYDYPAYSQLVGPFVKLAKGKYSVQYRKLTSKKETYKALALTFANIGIEIGFLVWLFGSFFASLGQPDTVVSPAIIAILVGIFIVEAFRLINMVTLCAAALAAKDPVPVRPQRGTRVAFTTTIVPSKEPFDVVRKALIAMKAVKHNGPVDVWLLDEGNDPTIKRACKKLGVKHFSRTGIAKWDTKAGPFKTKTKFGNYNAWLQAHGGAYDYIISVDPDHIPLPNFAQRLLGYFRDPDVAFVVGPQVYGNFDNAVTRGAESQAYIFQAAIQRGGNAYHSAMFVGTNHAYRVSAWDQIGGFQDSITEDMLTSLEVHTKRNPKTGNYWKSVYTPDVVAVGEGPSAWTDFFSQQLRWARGSNEVLFNNFFGLLRRLPWRARIHYSMIISYYPTVAISWVVGIFVSMLYLVLGETGVDISAKIWLALYIDVLALQVILYGWLRKYNVSPHERRGTLGISGMLFSILSAPIYVTALVATILRRKAKFVVTPKGDSASPDTWRTFSKHLMWSGVVVAFLIFSIVSGNSYPAVKVWCLLTLAVCLMPVLQWQGAIWPETKERLLRVVHFLTPRKLSRSTEK